MPVRCKLCQGLITDRSRAATCECGWRLDDGCREGHDGWCPRHGEERWVGAVEI
jgi:hypothetical protein